MPSNDSFINANHLNPKQLADLLTSIIANENKYDEYFAFKKKPISESFRQMGEMSYVHPNVVKRICDHAIQKKENANPNNKI
jgi:hypothetical protein